VKLTLISRDNERRHEVTERAQKQLDSFARDAERKLAEKMELISENKEANIKALQHRLHQHVSHLLVVLLHFISGCLQLLEILQISWNFSDVAGKFNCQLKYDNMPITEPNLVMPLNPRNCHYVAAKATYIRLLHGKIGILEGFFGPSSVHRGRTHIVFR